MFSGFTVRFATLEHRVKLALQAMILVGLGLSLWRQQWENAFLIVFILALTLLPTLLHRRFSLYIPPEFEFFSLLFIFSSLFLGEIHGYYIRYWWWDVVLHASSGVLFGILGLLLVYVLNHEERIQLHMEPLFIALFSLSFAVAIGAVWEIFEFGMDNLFGLNMQKSGLDDTMEDLMVDAIGAGLVSAVGYICLKSGRQSIITRMIGRFVKRNPRLFRRR